LYVSAQSDFPARNQRRAHRFEEARRNELEEPKWRELSLCVGAALYQDGIMPAIPLHGDFCADRDGRYAGNRFQLVQNLFFHTDDALGFFYAWFPEYRCERPAVARGRQIPDSLSSKRENVRIISPEADQQNESQCHLHNHQRVPRTMLLSALAGAAASFTDPGRQMHAGVLRMGTHPNSTLASSEIASVKSKTGPLMPTWLIRGSPAGSSATSTLNAPVRKR